ncbi:dienelactone hydrolase family protein [Tropicimonas sp. IMCC34043]|uniref:dienelactone hydrolase family protein n=1 Tax=Tropicimonas sp. IMCC34043 TaxID=2248760 RepID=UPI0013005301|nr:dienelactone hydrolase family protein [Tropicimonas sp. IMCC34043]
MAVGEFISVQCDDGEFEAYLAQPAGGCGGGVLLLAEIYNVNHWVQDVAERYAAAGYNVLAPDLFWRQEPGLRMAYTPENQQKGRKLALNLDTAQALHDLDVCAAHLRGLSGSNGKVGIMGFCLGGQLAYLYSATADPDACSVYYGTRLQEMTEKATELKCPTILHFGEADQGIPVSAGHEIDRLTADRSDVTVHVYADAPHGFGRFGYPPHREEHAALAEQRTLDLFARCLR